MREILFRGKCIANGEWVDGDLIHNDNEDFPMSLIGSLILSRDKRDNNISFDGYCLYEVAPATIGQYTGLTDKNGRRIFEGDIVKETFEGTKIEYEGDWSEFREEVDFYGHKIGTVTFTGTGTHLKATHGELWVNGEAAEDWKPSRRTRLTACRCEVIGNIYDNPELVKQV